MLREELINPVAFYEVLEEHGVVLAYGGYHKIIDEGHITNIAVLPTRRHEGLGTKLLAKMLNDMKNDGVLRTTLEVNEHNENAIKLYEKFGFKLSGRRPKYYEGVDDALIYWLKL
jgi:ribosomal-protein-alanine acetyltransferase